MLNSLSKLYELKQFKGVLHPQDYVEGMLFGACAAPEIPMPDQWLVWAIATSTKIKNKQDADLLTSALFERFRVILHQMKDTDNGNDHRSLFSTNRYNLNDKKRLQLWFGGVIFAHQELDSLWAHAWDKMRSQCPEDSPLLAKQLKHCLSMFSTFANIPLAIDQAEARGHEHFEQHIQQMALSLPEAITQYVDISGTLATYLPNQFETFKQTRSDEIQ